ncbi:MAG: galactose oxidase-like domain-containing protein, partial [Granulosicoccaceae bacterium]
PRSQHNLTVLPDGTVLATGGHSSTEVLIDVDSPVFPSELWDPETGQWTEMASLSRTRQYHSVGLLLPDARVLVAGGGYCGPCDTYNYHEQSAEIFSPPYLFDANGDPAARPDVSATPERVNYASSFNFELQGGADLERVILLKPGSTTHSHNQDQRYISLDFTRSGSTVTAVAPATRNLAPPGHYMLFALDQNGVPSEAAFVLVGQPTVVAGQEVVQSVNKGELDIYAVESYAGDATLRVSLTDVQGDVDLYIRKDLNPGRTPGDNHDCGSARFGNTTEVCEVSNPGRHTWYVGVSAWEDSNYQLEVSQQSDASQVSGEIDPAKRIEQVTPAGGSDGSSSGGGGALGGFWVLLALLRFRLFGRQTLS